MTLPRLALSAALLAVLLLAACGAAVTRQATRNEMLAETQFPPLGQFVTVEGRRVHVLVKGRGPDLVLIHGASGNLRDFSFSMVDKLADRYRVLAFDRPGLGYTEQASEVRGAANTRAESPVEQALLLQAAAAKLGAKRPIVLGQSYGAAVAMAWALERPQNVAALVIVSGVTQPWPGGLGPQYPLLASKFGGTTLAPLMAATLKRHNARIALDTIFAPHAPPPGYADYIGVELALRRETLRANARQVNGLKPHLKAMAPRYPQVRVPVEIVHGVADRIVGFRLHAAALAQQLPDARLTPLPGVGHMPHHTVEPVVIAAIDRTATRAGLR